MNSRSFPLSTGVISFLCLLMMSTALSDEPPETPQDEGTHHVPVDVARDRAKLLTDVYVSTLDVMHHRYFHGDRAVVPARAMEDVFDDMKRQTQIEARWIAVTMRAMSIDHDPETSFEKQVVREIKSGKTEVETVRDGYYRRAVAIPLSGGCVSCHGGLFRQSTRKHFAGLVISIPIQESDETSERTQDAP